MSDQTTTQSHLRTHADEVDSGSSAYDHQTAMALIQLVQPWSPKEGRHWDAVPFAHYSDSELAQAMRVSQATVARRRTARGIAAPLRNVTVDWEAVADAFGKVSDFEIGRVLGVHYKRVFHERNRRGIKAASKPLRNWSAPSNASWIVEAEGTPWDYVDQVGEALAKMAPPIRTEDLLRTLKMEISSLTLRSADEVLFHFQWKREGSFWVPLSASKRTRRKPQQMKTQDEELLAFFAAGGLKTTRDVAERFRLTMPQARVSLRRLVSQGKLNQVGNALGRFYHMPLRVAQTQQRRQRPQPKQKHK